ncbi:potassium voltage-gated channel subfamily G member 3 [Puma concolor]|uniref:Potassium voltage-gated channel subfamily G member 3 n=1 Tax=Puma concolor TaxID=9696 RepID=A0A6P6I4G3_PUMCO|nr:potassium voltage-gated channel subfamily G member 3 [Puma concolor]
MSQLGTTVLTAIIEAICIGWFTAECIVRFIVSKNKCEFVKRPLNIIDLLAITPYYISVLMTVFTGENSQLQRAGVTLRVLRMMRIFWVIKLARHFIGLQTLGLTLKRCYREMVMLLVFICVAMAIFSALSQLLEHGLDLETSNKDFASIPAACCCGRIVFPVTHLSVHLVTAGLIKSMENTNHLREVSSQAVMTGAHRHVACVELNQKFWSLYLLDATLICSIFSVTQMPARPFQFS